MLTSPFDAPRPYPGNHEGVDYDIINQPPDSTEPVLCLYDGVVYRSENNNTAYGHFVVTKHQNNGFAFYIWYAHMDSRFVVPGQVVKRGDPVGELGATGGNWGEHIHINLQAPGFGLSGYVVSDVVDPAPFISMTPAGAGISMPPYFLPTAGDFGDICSLANNWGDGDERQQLQREGNLSYVTKNQNWERRRIASDGIYLELDTSPNESEYYTIEGSPWLPLVWSVGSEYTRTETVRFFRKSDCTPSQAPYSVTNKIKFNALHSSWTSQGGVTLNDVIELHWLIGGVIEETYRFAPGKGLVSWGNRAGKKSWVTEIIPVGQQQNNIMEIPPCLN